MRSASRRRAALGVVVLLALAATTAWSEEAQRLVGIHVMVSHVSQRPGKVDPKGRELHRRLQREFPVRSIRVIERRRVLLRVDQVDRVQLPTGRWVQVRPLSLRKAGCLLAVDVEGGMKADLAVGNRHPVDLGIERYQDGKLVVTLEPEF